MEYKTYNYDSFVLYTINTDKFKNGYIEVHFRDDIRNINIPQRNMLANLMRYSSSKYKTNKEMKIASEDLYKIGFSSSTSRVGYNLFTTFSLDFLHPRFIKEKNYLEKSLQFFFDLILNPDINDGEWNKQSFEIIKELLHSNIDVYKENPLSQAIVTSKEKLFKDSYQAKRLIGTHEELDKLTPKSLASDYKDMLENSICEIVLIGDFNMDELAKIINKRFYKPSIVEKQIEDVIEGKIIPYQEEREKGVHNQTQILQYYILDSLTEKEKKYVVPLFRHIVGTGSLSDKMGLYLRIQNSLCYTYYSAFNLPDSYFLLSTGVKEENIKKALQCFDQIMREMKKGKISQEELETKKLKILTNAKFQLDNIYAIADSYYSKNVFKTADIEDYINEIPKITIKDLKELTSKMHKCYTYILEEGGSHE